MKCDTQVETVINYLNCFIKGDNIQNILVQTNGEKGYLEQLQEIFLKAFPELEMISLDNLIEKLNQGNLHSEDAFLQDNCFHLHSEVEKVIVSMARYHLERGHTHFKKCDRGGNIKTWSILRDFVYRFK
jgi:hypothetical protein